MKTKGIVNFTFISRMQNLQFWQFLLSYGLIFTFVSCDLWMEKEGTTGNVAFNNQLSCNLDPAAFGKIFTHNIHADLNCAHESLLKYMSFVRDKERRGELNQRKLKKYLQRYEKNTTQETLDMLDGFFEANYLIFGGNPEYINKDELAEIISFLKLFNTEVMKINKFFERKSSIGYPGHLNERIRVEKSFFIIARRLKLLMDTSNNYAEVNFHRFIDRFFKNGDQEVYNKITKLYFLKKPLVSGINHILNRKELRKFLVKLPDLAAVGFDLIMANKTNFDNAQGDYVDLLYGDIQDLKKILHKFSSSEVVFKLKDLTQAVDLFMDLTDFEVSEFIPEIVEIKRIFLGGKKTENFEFSEMEALIKHLEYLLLKSKYFVNIYQHYEHKLNTYCEVTFPFEDDPNKCSVSIDFSDFPAHTGDEHLFRQDFARIVHNYRFFKGSNEAPIYDRKRYHRNSIGAMQITIMEYLAEQIFNEYGGTLPGARGRDVAISLDGTGIEGEKGLLKLIKVIERPLKKLKIIVEGRKFQNEYIKTAENLMLMSTLFQYQSNGGTAKDHYMEIPEVVEFLISIFVALDTREVVQEKLMSFCSNLQDRVCDRDDPTNCERVKVSCFRENFANLLYEELPSGKKFSTLLPSLTDYIENLQQNDPDGLDYFYSQVEAFTRVCTHYENGDEVPMTKNDMLSIFAGLLNIESTILHHDKNQNNFLDKNEVQRAFDTVYKGAITGMIKDEGGLIAQFGSALSGLVFKFLVKYNLHPTKPKKNLSKFLWFAVKPWGKKQPAHRETIAAILKVLGESMPQNPFYCCRFRDSGEGDGQCTPEEIGYYDDIPKPDNIP